MDTWTTSTTDPEDASRTRRVEVEADANPASPGIVRWVHPVSGKTHEFEAGGVAAPAWNNAGSLPGQTTIKGELIYP